MTHDSAVHRPLPGPLARSKDSCVEPSAFAVLDDGGRCYLMCFSDRQPGDFGPRRVSQDELRAAFAPASGWRIASIAPDTFEINLLMDHTAAQAWLATIERTGDAAPPAGADSPA